jgi:hypothetical protein
MSKRQKPPTRPEHHVEKPVMDQPQEEFVAPKSVPSRDVSSKTGASKTGASKTKSNAAASARGSG